MDDIQDEVTFEPSELVPEGLSEEELEAQESRADTKVTKLKKELDQCKAEKQEYLDGWQRSKADYVNALKRFDIEKMDAVNLGVVKATHAFLPVVDSLARAEAAGEIPDAFASIARQLHAALESLRITKVGEVGHAFNPEYHEALGQDKAESKEHDDTVTAVLEHGYKSGDTVIRPAKVRVAHFEGQ